MFMLSSSSTVEVGFNNGTEDCVLKVEGRVSLVRGYFARLSSLDIPGTVAG